MLNNITLMGRLVKDPELYTTQTSGTSVVSFTLAVQRSHSTDNKADFIDCTAWSGTADFIKKYFVKGQLMAVQGRLQTDTYTDNTGSNRKSCKVVVSEVSFCESKGNKSDVETAQQTATDNGFSFAEEDLPWG